MVSRDVPRCTRSVSIRLAPPSGGVRLFSARPPVGGFSVWLLRPASYNKERTHMVCSLYGATDIVRPFKGRLVGAPLWGCLLCAPLWGVFVGAPLWGSRCAPLWDVCPAPLYGAVCAPLYGASFRCPFMGRPLIMWVCVPYLFARVLRLACLRFPGFCEPIGCSRHTKLVCCACTVRDRDTPGQRYVELE